MQGIKFNQDGITAILEGRKTMTRRPIKQAVRSISDNGHIRVGHGLIHHGTVEHFINECSKYKIGETVQLVKVSPMVCSDSSEIELLEQDYGEAVITNIKVERLQDISEEDCIKEGVKREYLSGVEGYHYYINTDYLPMNPSYVLLDNYKDIFEFEIWDKLPYQEPYDWNSNPYVFVYEFEVVK